MKGLSPKRQLVVLALVLGAIVALILYRKLVQHRPITGPGARRLPPQ